MAEHIELVAEFVAIEPHQGVKRPKGKQRLGSVRWEGYDHTSLWNMIMDARPDDVFDRYDRWTRLGESLGAVNKTVQTELNTLFQTWQGTAAMGAALSNTKLLSWSQDAVEVTQRVGEGLGTYGNALVHARKTMPQPRMDQAEQAFRAGDGATVWGGPENAFTLLQLMSDHQASAKERTEAKQGAVEVMRAFESESVNVERSLGTYSAAPNVAPQGTVGPTWVQPQFSPPPGTPGGPLPGTGTPPAGSGGAGQFPGGPGGPGGAGGPGGYYPGTGPGGTGGGPGGVGGPGGRTGAGVGTRTGTGPGAGRYGSGTGPGGRYGAGYGPGASEGAGGRYGAGASEGATGRGGAAAGQSAGSRGPGGLSGAGGGAAAESAAARGGAASGSSGRGGSGMYPPMGGGAGQDDDTEKRVAAYLVDDDDLFDDERTVAPPVFGA